MSEKLGKPDYWLRPAKPSDLTGATFEAAGECHWLVIQELRARGWKATGRDVMFGVQICLRAKGLNFTVIPNSRRRTARPNSN